MNERKVKWGYRRASKFGFGIVGNVYWKRYICIQNERKSVLECRNIVKGRLEHRKWVVKYQIVPMEYST